MVTDDDDPDRRVEYGWRYTNGADRMLRLREKADVMSPHPHGSKGRPTEAVRIVTVRREEVVQRDE